ncbi:hypothetical protein Q1695_010490 [Nippostrongylus brasiliensis]|nr:hypothetical protein Q1695_010490 [Nippostrongylus brasiliensis]
MAQLRSAALGDIRTKKWMVGKGFDFRRLSFEVVQQAPWDAPIVPISAVYGSAGVDGKPSSTFCIGVDTRLKPVLLSIDVIVKSMMIALAPRWVNGNRNPHDWLGRFPSPFRVSRRVHFRLSSAGSERRFNESRKQAKETKARKGHHSSGRRIKEYRFSSCYTQASVSTFRRLYEVNETTSE